MAMRPEYAVSPDEAHDFLCLSRVIHLAGNVDGVPVVRSENFVVLDGHVWLHGVGGGDVGRLAYTQVAFCTERVVASIPSYFVDPTIACPASTYYTSAAGRGVLEPAADVELKARVLEAFMAKYQPEGGYRPIVPTDPTYRNTVTRLWVARIAIQELAGKKKLGQNRSRAQIERVCHGLFARGAPGDLEAIDLILDAHPERPSPSFLRGPHGLSFACAPAASDVNTAVALLRDQYWTRGLADSVVESGVRNSNAWVGLRTSGRALVGMARAIADDDRLAWIADVIVHPEWRNRGVGRALMRFLLDHPRVRRVRKIRLMTRDRQGFYESLAFAMERDEGRLLLLSR